MPMEVFSPTLIWMPTIPRQRSRGVMRELLCVTANTFSRTWDQPTELLLIVENDYHRDTGNHYATVTRSSWERHFSDSTSSSDRDAAPSLKRRKPRRINRLLTSVAELIAIDA